MTATSRNQRLQGEGPAVKQIQLLALEVERVGEVAEELIFGPAQDQLLQGGGFTRAFRAH